MSSLLKFDFFHNNSQDCKCNSGPFQDPSACLHMEFEEAGEYFDGKVVVQPEEAFHNKFCHVSFSFLLNSLSSFLIMGVHLSQAEGSVHY